MDFLHLVSENIFLPIHYPNDSANCALNVQGHQVYGADFAEGHRKHGGKFGGSPQDIFEERGAI